MEPEEKVLPTLAKGLKLGRKRPSGMFLSVSSLVFFFCSCFGLLFSADRLSLFNIPMALFGFHTAPTFHLL